MTDRRLQSDRTVVSARSGAAVLLTAGLLFLLYPALRPWGDVVPGLEAARAYADPRWPLAHFVGAIGFHLLPVGLLALREVIGGRLATVALATTWLGAGLVLPFFGAEAFGLHVVGVQVVASGDLGLLGFVEAIRNGPLQMTSFAVGLMLLAVGPGLAGVAVWRSRVLPRWSALLFAAGFTLYLPQFFGPPAVRIAHGVLVMVGCVVLAYALTRRRPVL